MLDHLSQKTRRVLPRLLLLATLVVVALLGAWFLQSTIPRYIVLASGPKGGVYHAYAQRYREILARDGVKVEERLTEGASDNLAQLLAPKSRVDVAFMQGGVATPEQTKDLIMLASLYYEPLWIFYRDPGTLTKVNQLRGKRLAIGIVGSGTRALVLRLLTANGLAAGNGIGQGNTVIVDLGGDDALRALQAGFIDAVFYVGGAGTASVQQALHDPVIKLMSLDRAEADARSFPFLTKLTLPAGMIDLADNIPDKDVAMVGTKAMLVAHEGFSPPLIQLLQNAAVELHGGQGSFEGTDEFPNTARLDFPVSEDAVRHLRFGPSLLHRYLPFAVATYVERLVVLLVPLLVIVVPLVNFLPKMLAWRVQSRVYRLYGELLMLERDVGARTGTPPVEQWLSDLDRIDQAAARLKTTPSFASQAYTLREHIGLVRRAVMTKVQSFQQAPAASDRDLSTRSR